MIRQISVKSAATNLMALHDRNQDGVISLKPEKMGPFSDVFKADERIANVPGRGMVSSVSVLYGADKNRDEQVTREELEEAIRRFDTDGDGFLAQHVRRFWEVLTFRPQQELEYNRYEKTFSRYPNYQSFKNSVQAYFAQLFLEGNAEPSPKK